MNEPGLADINGNSFTGADAVGIDRLIEGSFIDAWRRVAKVAPRTWLGNKSFKSEIGVIDTFTFASGAEGFVVDDLVYIESQTGKRAYLKVTSQTAGNPTAFALISGGSGFIVSSYLAKTYTGIGDITGAIEITITAIKTTLNNPIPSLTEGTGYIKLPDDFYLLTKFKMTTWKVSAMEAAVTNTRVANLQANDWTRGSTMRPAVVIDNIDIDGLIKPALRYYSLQKGLLAHTVEEAIYVPTPVDLKDLNDLDELEISHQIIEPLCYLNAATVFTILEKPTIAAALEARAEAILPGILSLKGTNATVKQ